MVMLVTALMETDLARALKKDANTSGGRRITWAPRVAGAGGRVSRMGLARRIALDVARGLAFLHGRKARPAWCSGGTQCSAWLRRLMRAGGQDAAGVRVCGACLLLRRRMLLSCSRLAGLRVCCITSAYISGGSVMGLRKVHACACWPERSLMCMLRLRRMCSRHLWSVASVLPRLQTQTVTPKCAARRSCTGT